MEMGITMRIEKTGGKAERTKERGRLNCRLLRRMMGRKRAKA
jgi:hypothetical protein